MSNEFEKNEEVKDEKVIDGQFEETASEEVSGTEMIEKKKAKLSKKQIAGICLAAVGAVGLGVVIGMKLGVKPKIPEVKTWKTTPEVAAKMLADEIPEPVAEAVVDNSENAVEVSVF